MSRVSDENDDVFTLPEYFYEYNQPRPELHASVRDEMIITTSSSSTFPKTVSTSSASDNQKQVQTRKNTTRTSISNQVPFSLKRNIYKKKILNPTWKMGNFIQNELLIKFEGNVLMPEQIKSFDSPKDFFLYFFDDNLLLYIVEQTIMYSVEVAPSKPLSITKTELKKFIGILIMMSIVHVPNSRSYWSENLANNVIRNCMSINIFENIKRFLHFNNNALALARDHQKHDRLYKIRPVIESLKKKFASIPLEENLLLDEQLCPTKARSYLK